MSYVDLQDLGKNRMIENFIYRTIIFSPLLVNIAVYKLLKTIWAGHLAITRTNKCTFLFVSLILTRIFHFRNYVILLNFVKYLRRINVTKVYCGH